MSGPKVMAAGAVLGTLLLATVAQAQVGNDNATGTAGQFDAMVTTAGSYEPYSANLTRSSTDLVIASVGSYPLAFTRTLNSRYVVGANGGFGQAGFWSHPYQWSIESEIISSNTGSEYLTSFTVNYPDGRTIVFSNINSGTDPYLHGPPGVRDRFERGTECYLHLPDGGRIWFHMNTYREQGQDGVTTFSFDFKGIYDPYGQLTTITYPSDGSVTITEPAGRTIKLFYSSSTGLLDHITGSDGRPVQYIYDNYSTAGGVRYTVLSRVIYFGDWSQAGSASYTYQDDNIDPDGPPLIASCYDPMFAGPMKSISYSFATGNNADGTATVYGQLQSENHQDPSTGAVVAVSSLAVNGEGRTETRGDGPTRTFTYSGGRLMGSTDVQNVGASQGYDGAGFVYFITDRRGNTTNFTSDPWTGALKVTTFPLTPPDTVEATAQLIYGSTNCPDPNNRDSYNPYYLYSAINESNFPIIYKRYADKRVWHIDYPDNRYEEFTYNNFGQVLTHRLRSGGTESFEYDPAGRRTAYRDPYHDPINKTGNPTLWYLYDPLDRLWKVTDSRGGYPGDPAYTTTFEYNSRGQRTRTTFPPDPQDGTPHSTSNAYNPDGTVASTTDELGHSTSFTYDDYKRLRSITTPQRSASDTLPRTTWLFYDRYGNTEDYRRTAANVTFAFSPGGKQAVNTYDDNLRKNSVTVGTGAETSITNYWYNAAGNLEQVIEPLQHPGQPYWGKFTSFAYDERNRLKSATDAKYQTTQWRYDAAGNKTSVTRPGNPPMQFVEYDPMNRLKHQIDERGVDTYFYYEDNARNLTSRVDGNGNTYSYTYDAMNRKTAMTYPDGSFEDFSYDAAGNMTIYGNRARNHRYSSFDNRNRQTWFNLDDGVTQPQLTVYDAASRVTSIQNWEADITLTYDDANHMTSETESIKSYGLYAQRSTVYQYDADGNRSRLTYPQGYQFLYGYTSRNQLDNIKLDPAIFGGTYNTPLVQYAYDASGNRTRRTVLSGAHAEYDIDELNRIRGQANYFANGQMGRFDYGFDAMNRRKYEQRDWGTADGYQYDPSDEVTGYQRDGTLNGDGTVSASFWNNTGLHYDNNGNRTQVTGSGADSYAINNLNQYTSDANTGGMSYDPKGNLTYAAGWTYTYDAQNRLTRMENGGTVIVQTYDPLNRVITRNVNGAVTQNVWDGWNLIEEHRPDWSIQRCYLQGAHQNEMVAAFDGGVYTTHWFWQDGRGNTSHITGDNAYLLERYTYDLSGAPKFYDEWGNERLGGSVYDARFLFAGSQYLPETGLYDMRNRFYHSGLARFLQPDPIGFAGDPSNLYRHCGNSSANISDSTGLSGTLTIYSNYGNVLALWPNGETGHTWISFGSDNTGITRFYGTDYYSGVRFSDGYSADVMRQTWINDNAEAQLFAYVSFAQSLGRDAWSWLENCTTFATNAWALATGEGIQDYNAFGVGSPSAVADSIVRLNGGHDYAFHFTDGGNGYYFNDGSFGRYDSNGNGYYIWDPTAPPGALIGQTTDGEPVYQSADAGLGANSFGGGLYQGAGRTGFGGLGSGFGGRGGAFSYGGGGQGFGGVGNNSKGVTLQLF